MDNDEQLKHLLGIIKRLVRSDKEASEELLELTRESSEDDSVIRELAEELGMLNLQRDVYAYRLETMIEDLLHAQREIDEARHDPLTGLPNRTIFHELLDQAVQTASSLNPFALMFVDLDKFKQVNDTLGHDAGDEILKIATQRMLSSIKSQDTLSRIGGDEFTIIARDIESRDDLAGLAQRLVDSLCDPCQLKAGSASVGASVGVSLFPNDVNSAIALLKNADIAMYEAKERGRNQYRFFMDLVK